MPNAKTPHKVKDWRKEAVLAQARLQRARNAYRKKAGIPPPLPYASSWCHSHTTWWNPSPQPDLGRSPIKNLA